LTASFCDLQALFQAAVNAAAQTAKPLLWYPYAWLFGYLKGKAELLSEAAAAHNNALLDMQSERWRVAALSVACGGCADVLRSYRCAFCTVPSFWPLKMRFSVSMPLF